jgi:hypothetical protein
MLSGLDNREYRMNVGKTLFAQVMEFVPWKTFARIIERYKGDAGVRTLGCADLFRIMAFSQLRKKQQDYSMRRLPDPAACPSGQLHG